MQSTVRALASQQLNQDMQFLTECLTRDGLFESFDSQAETSGRMPILAGHSLMQQAQRMKQRPGSLTGVRLAESNRFAVNLESQSETINHPQVFMNTPAFTKRSTFRASLTNVPIVNAPDFVETSDSPAEFEPISLANSLRNWSCENPFLRPIAFDSQSNEASSDHRASSNPWNMRTSNPRLPAYKARTVSVIADPDSLRGLIEEAQEREAQRITARMKAFRPAAQPESQGLAKIVDLAKAFYQLIQAQLRRLSKSYTQLRQSTAR